MKLHLLSILAAGALLLSACQSGSSSEGASEVLADFDASQPFLSGEYRVQSFQYTDTTEQRQRFDGRMLAAIAPDGSGLYIYENGNRTKFKQRLAIDRAFQSEDSVFVAHTQKGEEIRVRRGQGVDTLLCIHAGRPVKIAFETKPMQTASAPEMWKRITAAISEK